MRLVDKLLQELASKVASVDNDDFWQVEAPNYDQEATYDLGFEDGVIMLARTILKKQGKTAKPFRGTNKIYLPTNGMKSLVIGD